MTQTPRFRAAVRLVAVLSLPIALVLPASAQSQSLRDRIAQRRDGTVGISYAARSGVCGDGRSMIGDAEGPDGFTMYLLGENSVMTGTFQGNVRDQCVAGPVRVLLTLRDGELVRVAPTVGGKDWQSAPSLDLGTVDPAQAATYLLGAAAALPERSARDAMLAASIADGVRVGTPLARMARTRSLPSYVRESALRWTARAAEREGDRAAMEEVRAIASDEDDATAVRERAIRSLNGRADEGFLRQLYAKTANRTLQERIIRTVGEGGSTESRNWLRTVAESSRDGAELRERAVRVLAEEWGDYTFLRELYSRAGEIAPRERIIRVLGEGGRADDMRWLRGIAAKSDEPTALRERALRVLTETGLPTRDLAALYDSVGVRSLRERAINLLAERGDKTAIDKLNAIARDDEDSDLRRRALRKLLELKGS
jgi:hypothetical protein